MTKKSLILMLLVLPMTLLAEGTDDFGTWVEIGIKKSLSKQWSLGLEGEYRSQYKMRGSVGVNAEYKPCKYFKAGISYNLLYSQKNETREEHYRKDIVSDENWNGYDIKANDWYPRHRLGVDATGTVKVWHWLRISLRERYQLTYKPVSYCKETKVRYDRFIDGNTGEPIYVLRDDDEDDIPDYPMTESDRKDSETIHMLRSRLKLAVDKKGWALSPFVSTETHNNLGDGMRLEKVRSAVGLDYKVSKQHEVSMSYILTCNIFDDEDDHARLHERMHALGIGYTYKF